MQNRKKELSKVAEIFGVSTRSVRKWFEEGKIEEKFYEKIKYPGGYKYLMDPMGAPEPHRSKWIRMQAQEDPKAYFEEINNQLYQGLKQYQKDYVDRWLTVFSQFEGLKGKQLKSALKIYRQENPDLRGFSYPNYRKVKREYDQMGLTALVPQWGGREGDSKIRDDVFEIYETGYMDEARRTKESCWRDAFGFAHRQGYEIEDFAHVRTFHRRLVNEAGEEFIYRSRHGEAAWRRKYEPYNKRDKSGVLAGECWVGDHRQADVEVVNPDTGKRFRPWITAWRDFKSGKWMAVYPHEHHPNKHDVLLSFYWGITEHGHKPGKVYIDNGKDYRSYAVSGGRKNRKKASGQTDGKYYDGSEQRRMHSNMHRLNIDCHFALPYNAQAKNIEPAFKGFIDLEKTMPGYVGKDSASRPESYKKNHRLTFDDFCRMYEMHQKNLDNSTSYGAEHGGLTPNQLYNKERTVNKIPAPEVLKELLVDSTKARSIGRNGVTVSEVDRTYYHPEMAGLRGDTKVFVAYDPRSPETAWIYDMDERPLFRAESRPDAPAFAETDEEHQIVADLQADKRRESKKYRSYMNGLTAHSPDEYVKNRAAFNEAQKELAQRAGTWEVYKPASIHQIIDVPATKSVQRKQDIIENRKKVVNMDLEVLSRGERPGAKKFNSIFKVDNNND